MGGPLQGGEALELSPLPPQVKRPTTIGSQEPLDLGEEFSQPRTLSMGVEVSGHTPTDSTGVLGDEASEGTGESIQEASEAERVATGASEASELAGEAGAIEAIGGGPEDLLTDIASIGLAIGSAFLSEKHAEAPPPVAPISASTQIGI